MPSQEEIIAKAMTFDKIQQFKQNNPGQLITQQQINSMYQKSLQQAQQ